MTLKQIAEDFGISEASLSNWLKAADVDAGQPVVQHGLLCGADQPGDATYRLVIEVEAELERRVGDGVCRHTISTHVPGHRT